MATAVSAEWLWDPSAPNAPVLRWRAAGQTTETLYYTQDANWNTTALVDPSGAVVERYAYDPYGKPTFLDGDCVPTVVQGFADGAASAYANTILYAGYSLDAESNLYHTDYREYDYGLGRWTGVDPAGGVDGSNLYQYCLSNPVVGTDPTGLVDWGTFSAGIFQAVGGAIDFYAGLGTGDAPTVDKQQVANGYVDFLQGLCTAAGGLTDNPIFGQVAAALSTAQGLANNGLMVAGAFKAGKLSALSGGNPKVAAQSAEQGGLNLYKLKEPQVPPPGGWRAGDRMLSFPNQGNAKANWRKNSGMLRKEMSSGKPIYDSYRNPITGEQLSTDGFLKAERNLLESRGWQYNPQTGAYHPPTI